MIAEKPKEVAGEQCEQRHENIDRTTRTVVVVAR
jgi:hypothetical protein